MSEGEIDWSVYLGGYCIFINYKVIKFIFLALYLFSPDFFPLPISIHQEALKKKPSNVHFDSLPSY